MKKLVLAFLLPLALEACKKPAPEITPQDDNDPEITVLTAPTGVMLEKTGSSSLTFKWDVTTQNGAQYELHLYKTPYQEGNPVATKTLNRGLDSWTFSGLTPDTGYLFRIRCIAEGAEASPWVDLTSSTQAEAKTWTFKVMSFNVRLITSEDDPNNNWDVRKVAFPAMLKAEKPLVMGVQEAKAAQVSYIASNATDYAYYGIGRDAQTGTTGEMMAIFYDKNQLTLGDHGTFWLSETPDKCSLGWDAACRRTATWCVFTHKASGKKFIHINTHLDHKGTKAREEGLKLIIQRLAVINPSGLPSILTGDFNVTPSSSCLTPLIGVMNDARLTAAVTDNSPTYNGYSSSGGKIIDYIWHKGFNRILSYRVVKEKFQDIPFISDHYPITAELEIVE